MRPGSRASLIMETAAALTAELGRGAVLSEMRAAFESATGEAAPASFTAEVLSLVRRGVLERAGGRAGRTLYAAAGSGLAGNPPDDDGMKVLHALQAAYERLGRAISTREVRLELERLGLGLASSDPNAVRRRLATLARGRSRGPKDMHPPQVQRVEARAASGAPSAHWVPAGESARSAIAPRSRTDALRHAISKASLDLGRPVSRRELRWWLRTPAAVSAFEVVTSPTRISEELGRLARQDAGHQGQPGRVHTVTTPYTCHGGGEPRYAMRPTAPLEEALCGIDDAVHALRPADELHGAWVLARRAKLAGSEALGLVAAERHVLLTALAHQLCGGFRDWAHLVHRCRLAGRAMAAWAEAAQGMKDTRRDAWLLRLEERAYQVEGISKVLANPPQDVQPALRVVGSGATVTYRELQPILAVAVDRLGMKARNAKNLITQARRFPVEDSPGLRRFGQAGELPLSCLDRVDVLAGLWGAMSAPRARILLLNAHVVLGHILRDAEFVASLLRLTPTPLADDRRTLIAALGLLGEVPPLESTVDPTDSEDVAAWTLAAILATLGQAEPVLNDAMAALKGPPRNVVDFALLRIGAGYPFTAIE